MENLLIGLASVIVLGVGAQWLAWRLRLPSILLLLISGFLAGPVTGFLHPDELFGELLFPLVSISVAIILFEGGLTLHLADLPRVGDVIFRLISIGMLVTWGIATLAARFVLQMDWALALLLGSILVVTGPTVIGPLLRQIRPKGESGAVLKWEGILIDPVGAVLAVLIFEIILGGEFQHAPTVILLGVAETIVIGFVLGAVAAGIMIGMMRRYWVPDHLQAAFSLLLAVGFFALSNWLHEEAGLLTVTIMGVILANQKWVSVKHIVEFKENLRVLLIGSLFILLAARLELSDVVGLGWRGIIFGLILMVVARPLTVLVSTWRSTMSYKERLFLSWMAPRGIVAASVASVFAFELVSVGYEAAEQLVSTTFLVIVGTVSFYGLTAGIVARRLGLSEVDPQGVLIVGAHPMAQKVGLAIHKLGFRTMLLDTNEQNIKEAREMGLEAHYGDALAEEMMDELEFGGIGRILAMTSNNEVNSLATMHFLEMFGRAEVYQLSVGKGKPAGEQAPMHLNGRFLFANNLTYRTLQKAFTEGAVIETIPITTEKDYAALKAEYGERIIPLFLVMGRQQLNICALDQQVVPRAGQTMVAMLLAD